MINQEVQSAIGRPHQPLSELYKDIVLTPEEAQHAIDQALFNARYEKYAALNREKYRQKLFEHAAAPVKYTSKQLKQFLSELSEFVIDTDNERVVDLLCYYFSDDAQFEKYSDRNGKSYSLSKGILLFGGLGVGKTFLLSTFKHNQKQSYSVVACEDVEGVYAANGTDRNAQTGALGIKKYYGLDSISRPNQFGQNMLGYFFDDLGQEKPDTKYFGTERVVMAEILSQRYRNKLFTSTHITTNLGATQIKDTYGPRVADRMKEMFNLLEFPETAKSRRK
jgi:hypothetical protein